MVDPDASAERLRLWADWFAVHGWIVAAAEYERLANLKEIPINEGPPPATDQTHP